MTDYQCGMVEISALMRLKEEIMMINLTGKIVFVKTVYEASEIVEDEEKIKDAVNLVRTFTKYPDRTALTDSFIKSLELLADVVESQMEEAE